MLKVVQLLHVLHILNFEPEKKAEERRGLFFENKRKVVFYFGKFRGIAKRYFESVLDSVLGMGRVNS